MSGFDRIRCALVGHRPGPGTAWNHGYSFGHCLRCGRPIMRAVFGRWREPPRGYRIVWPAHRGRGGAALPPVTAARAAAWDFMAEDPVPRSRSRDHIAAFDFGDFMADEPAEEPPSPPPASRRRVS